MDFIEKLWYRSSTRMPTAMTGSSDGLAIAHRTWHWCGTAAPLTHIAGISELPHCLQNLAPDALAVWHFEHAVPVTTNT
jgi:hypothetical protein